MAKTAIQRARRQAVISARGVRVHNLKNIDVEIPLRRLIVITGVSGSGKSSLALDTLYAEGQRRYVESFSAYARQFLERMDKPDADAIEGIPPAVAIEQTNPVRNRRSTVGTATEVYDYLRLLYARIGRPFCPSCGRRIVASSVSRIVDHVAGGPAGERFMVTFPVRLSDQLPLEEQVARLRQLGFIRIWSLGQVLEIETGFDAESLRGRHEIEAVADRLKTGGGIQARLAEAVQTALKLGHGECRIRGLDGSLRRFTNTTRCLDCETAFPELQPLLFSFNHPLGACPRCSGFGATIDVDLDKVVPDKSLSLAEGAIAPWNTETTEECLEQLLEGAPVAGIPTDVPWRELSAAQQNAVMKGTDEFYGVMDFFDWLESKKYKLHVRVLLSRYRGYTTCGDCGGARLGEFARAVRVFDRTLPELAALTIEEASAFFEAEHEMSDEDREISRLILDEIRRRLGFLVGIGLGYVELDRLTRTLSGGEMERVNLATSLGSALVNTLYILDEPSVGLHPRDTDRLLAILRQLRDAGNTVVVVEHDRQIIESADHLLDMGPGAGERGGSVVFSGTPGDLKACDKSITGAYLSGEVEIPTPKRRREPAEEWLILRGAREHNLKDIDVRLPLGLFTCVTGVSGSGKSTLVQDTLYGAIKREKPGGYAERVGAHKRLEGIRLVDDVILVDQSPIGRSPRSNPVTYAKAFDEVRRLFADTREARVRNLSQSAFSFNTPGGRCEQCEGAGHIKVEMQFLADMYLRCDKCRGRRFREDILKIKYRGFSIADVLEMTVDEALSFFRTNKRISNKLKPLSATGLGYLKLGQPATTLSGGEAQRLKLSTHISGGTRQHVLFLFDEPTTGLHFDDIRKLLDCLNALVERGHSVVVIEHNLDVIKSADWVIDLGPDEGERGGEIVAAGVPEDIAACDRSYTGRYLRPVLRTEGA
jgi:excinuclease ABC subunit A